MNIRVLAVLILFSCLAACSPFSSSTTAPSLTASPSPTPDPKLGSVKGILMVRKDGAESAVSNANLYLGEMKKDGSGKEVAAAFDRVNSPRAGTDSEGHFMFSNVVPGRYALIMDQVRSSFMLNKPTDGSDLIFTVTAGGQVDAGKLVYDSLPDP